MKKRHIGQQTLPRIDHFGDRYTIFHCRNFHRQDENTAKQDYQEFSVNVSSITGCRLYESTFGYKNLIAHYMIGFIYTNNEGEKKEIIVSIEARRPVGETYKLRKGIIPGMYSLIYVWGLPSDLLALRKHIWHDPLVSYDLDISPNEAQELFTYYTHRTNLAHQHTLMYNAIWYNCITDVHRGLASINKRLFSITPRTVFSTGYVGYLTKKGLIKKI